MSLPAYNKEYNTLIVLQILCLLPEVRPPPPPYPSAFPFGDDGLPETLQRQHPHMPLSLPLSPCMEFGENHR